MVGMVAPRFYVRVLRLVAAMSASVRTSSRARDRGERQLHGLAAEIEL